MMAQAETTTTYEAVQNYNRLTRFLHAGRYRKLIEVLGRLAREIGDRRMRILDIGCGPGSAVGHIFESFDVDYVGIDYDPTFIDAAKARYGHLSNCRFALGDASEETFYHSVDADVVVALETLEHVPLNRVVRIVEHVCGIVRPRVFLVTVPVEIGPAVWIKNWGSALMGYDRQSGNIRETFWAGLYQLDRVPPHHVSHQGFDWRCLAQIMRVNAPMREVGSLPFSFIPKMFSPNVVLVSEPSRADRRLKTQDADAWKVNHQFPSPELH
ncbi:class I SAM-dependent methyltransferase [Neorhizobium petrolearium]|uniref:class I SAM-dependent methyltransferase n=1 Tax=Neorhizobium petrolearium TaxID=515361 RepID=UPI003F5CD096